MDSIAASLERAVQFHRAGQLVEAQSAYRAILTVEPQHRDALHLLGVIAHQIGQHDAAITLIGAALALDDRVPEYHNNIGEAFRALGHRDQALLHYNQALALRPDYEAPRDNRTRLLAATPPARPSDRALYRTLVAAIASHQITITVDPDRINHIDCPVAGSAYHTLDIYGTFALCVGALALLPLLTALVGITVILVINRRFVLPLAKRRMQRFVVRQILDHHNLWDRMWKFGGVTLTVASEGHRRCQSPHQDWRSFVAALAHDNEARAGHCSNI